MAIHLLRDYETQNITTNNRTYTFSYLLAIFLRRVAGYTHVGSTNYPINAVGTLLIATGDTTPTATVPTFPVGNKAGINLGSQKEYYVSIPISVRTVSSTDIGRILVLKSASYPTYNSGAFLIIGFDTATNSYAINYRTMGEHPPIEAADSLMWYLYDKDINCPILGSNNTKATGSYRGDGNSTTPRIILQSPHPLGWQVRICLETLADWNGGVSFFGDSGDVGACAQQTAIPGFNGNSAGDFATNGNHIHAPMWYNSSNTIYQGGAPGYGDNGTVAINFRLTIVADDTGQGVILYCRRPGVAAVPFSTITCFGMPENEPAPLPANNVARLFCIGSGYSGNDGFGGGRFLNGGALQSTGLVVNNSQTCQGISFSPYSVPTMCSPSMWAYVSGGAQFTSPIFDFQGGDSPFTDSTELLPVDIMQGTLDSTAANSNTNPVWPMAPRTMGTIPHVKIGRANFGEFSPTVDSSRSYQHLRYGVYIPWNGPIPIP